MYVNFVMYLCKFVLMNEYLGNLDNVTFYRSIIWILQITIVNTNTHQHLCTLNLHTRYRKKIKKRNKRTHELACTTINTLWLMTVKRKKITQHFHKLTDRHISSTKRKTGTHKKKKICKNEKRFYAFKGWTWLQMEFS